MNNRRGDAQAAAPATLFGLAYSPCPIDKRSPPVLFVVVDTEAEFDWTKPFARELTSVSAMEDIGRGQAVFEPYGLKPLYVVDYPVAAQPRGYRHLRAILERGACQIGAHLHPWNTPPFEESLDPRNSYPGNLDPGLEARKLDELTLMIETNFRIRPVFYKAGRYGFGPATAQTLRRMGFRVDLSILPGADLRRQGGPDFRAFRPVPYRIGDTGLLSMPMTRSEVGMLPALGRLGAAVHSLPGLHVLRVPSVLAHAGLAETITLTPEGVTAAEQIRLIGALQRHGCRRFVLHYHSPSLSPGHTPYAPDRAGADALVERMRRVCAYFFEEAGGRPGDPDALLSLQAALQPPPLPF